MLQAQIFISKLEMHGSQYLYKYIINFLLKNDIEGATVIRAAMGFGRDNVIQEPDRLFSFDEPPMVITFIDEDLKVKNVLNALRKITRKGLIVTHKVEVW